MIDTLLTLAADNPAMPATPESVLFQYGPAGLILFLVTGAVWRLWPKVIDGLKDLDTTKAQNQKMLLDTAKEIQGTAREIADSQRETTVAQQALTERLIEANSQARELVTDLERARGHQTRAG